MLDVNQPNYFRRPTRVSLSPIAQLRRASRRRHLVLLRHRRDRGVPGQGTAGGRLARCSDQRRGRHCAAVPESWAARQDPSAPRPYHPGGGHSPVRRRAHRRPIRPAGRTERACGHTPDLRRRAPGRGALAIRPQATSGAATRFARRNFHPRRPVMSLSRTGGTEPK